MAVLAVLFAAALLAVWRAGFSFFRVLLAVVIVGWIALNFMNPDFTVAQYNVSLSLRSPLTQVDVDYMARRSPMTRSLRWSNWRTPALNIPAAAA